MSIITKRCHAKRKRQEIKHFKQHEKQRFFIRHHGNPYSCLWQCGVKLPWWKKLINWAKESFLPAFKLKMAKISRI